VGLVLEVRHLPPARLPADRAREGRDTARALVGDLGDDRVQRQRLLGDAEGPTRDGRDQGDLVPVRQLPLRVGVLPVDGVEQPRRFLAQGERRPDVADAADPFELAFREPRALPQAGEQPHLDRHGGSLVSVATTEDRRETDSGIEIKPVYTADDEAAELELPGEFPFTRGPY